MKTKVITSKEKKKSFTVIARIKREKDIKLFRTEFQKMIRRCNHLLEQKIGYELIVVSDDRCSHLEEK